MTVEMLIPVLAGTTLLVALIVGVLGVRGAKNAKRKKLESALADE